MGVSKIGVPQSEWFIRENPIRIGDLGYPYFWKHPYWISEYTYFIQYTHIFWVDMNTYRDVCSLIHLLKLQRFRPRPYMWSLSPRWSCSVSRFCQRLGAWGLGGSEAPIQPTICKGGIQLNRLLPPSLVPFWLILLFLLILSCWICLLICQLSTWRWLGAMTFCHKWLAICLGPQLFSWQQSWNKATSWRNREFCGISTTNNSCSWGICCFLVVSNLTIFYFHIFHPENWGRFLSWLLCIFFRWVGWNHQPTGIFGTWIAGPFRFDFVTSGGHSWYHASSSCIRGMAAEWKLEWFLGERETWQHLWSLWGQRKLKLFKCHCEWKSWFFEIFPVAKKYI